MMGNATVSDYQLYIAPAANSFPGENANQLRFERCRRASRRQFVSGIFIGAVGFGEERKCHEDNGDGVRRRVCSGMLNESDAQDS
jgi:hypothetical protein